MDSRTVSRGVRMPDKQIVGICGIYCGACLTYRSSRDGDPKLIDFLMEQGLSKDEMLCNGCGSDFVTPRCSGCIFKECVKNKEIAYCYECPDFPCRKTTDLSENRASVEHKPHLKLCPRNIQDIRKIGLDEWLKQQEKRWSCQSCGRKLHWYAESCPSCKTKFYNAIEEARAALKT